MVLIASDNDKGGRHLPVPGMWEGKIGHLLMGLWGKWVAWGVFFSLKNKSNKVKKMVGKEIKGLGWLFWIQTMNFRRQKEAYEGTEMDERLDHKSQFVLHSHGLLMSFQGICFLIAPCFILKSVLPWKLNYIITIPERIRISETMDNLRSLDFWLYKSWQE